MKQVLAIAFAAIMLILSACSSGLDRKFDGTSEKSFESSLAAIKKSAKPDEIARLDDALLVLAITDVSIGYEGGIIGALQKISTRSPEQLADQLMPLVNGKTGREIIAAGQKRKKDEAARQLVNVDREIAQLKKMSEDKESSKGALAPIAIIEPTLRFNSVGPEKISVMDFKVRNGTDIGLTYLYLRGAVADSVSSKVLFSDDIKYKLADEPLLPGVTKSLRLPYSGRGKWNAPEIWGKDNLVFTIEVVNAENLQGHKVAAAFTHHDAKRLGSLENTRQTLEKILTEK
ncbi:MAG: hypothetical protein IPP88_03335 [Betaproteobacteria bacterium]|nr:hypothetical protein [Betaproteobacteria bacterium]